MDGVALSEIFGPTIQGEGPFTGRLATFVRFGLCNLDCLNCDTPYTWDWTGRTGTTYNRRDELTRTSVDDIVTRVRATAASLVVITGGEPLVQRNQVAHLAERFDDLGLTVQVETNGTLDALTEHSARNVHYVVSPKMAAMPTTRNAIDLNVLRRYAARPNTHLKVVCATADDVVAARSLADQLGWNLDRVWVMPEGVTRDHIASRTRPIADAAIDQRVNLTSRLHVLAWGTERGR